MPRRHPKALSKAAALLAICIFALGAAPAERSADTPMALRGASPAAMALDGAEYRQALEDGRRVVFTVTPELQRFASALLEDNDVPAGAIVVMNAKTGRILALAQHQRGVDRPSVAFDPSPPAASLFKIITTAALLESSPVSIDTVQCYHGGSQRIEQDNLVDSERDDTACASVSQALGHSINAVFAKLADRHLASRELLRYAERFGFNQAIPFDFAVPESLAEIPDDRLERARAAAGFWHTHLSPIHAAMMVQSVAHDGAMLRPYIVDKVLGAKGEVVYQGRSQLAGRPISAETARHLRAAMRETVANGTARKAFHHPGLSSLATVKVAGKTGTLTGQSPYRAYSWFAGFAPFDAPEVVIAVLIVNEPLWRIKASEAGARVLDKYFSTKKK
jgi:penicillin-binding protein A